MSLIALLAGAIGRQLTQVTFGAAGTGAAFDNSTPIAVAYPADIVGGSFLLLHVVVSDTIAASITTPTDWALIDSQTLGGGTDRSSIFWKRANGSESGSLDVTFSADIGAIGRMYRFSHGSGVEAVNGTADGSADTSINAVDVTTLGVLRMAVQCFSHSVNTTIAALTGESGADYTEAVAEFAASALGTLSCQVAQVATAAAITGGTATAGASGLHMMHGFAIKP